MDTPRIERILCPTDFSPFSSQALRHALSLARNFGSRLKVVYVIPHVFPGGESLYGAAPWLMTPEVRQRADEDMRRFLEPARELRVNHEIEIREGDPWREIRAAAEEMSSDFVVLGTHGRGGLDRLILGSVAEKLIRRLPCPVFTVSHEEGRTWAAPGLITRILCATDFSETSGHALQMALALAARYQSEITLLHVIETLPDFGDLTYSGVVDVKPLREDLEREARERLDKAALSGGPSASRIEPRAIFGRPYREILKTAAEERSDLIVIGAQGHGMIEHMLSGSTAQHVIRAATCPVLTVRRTVDRPREDGRSTGITLAGPTRPRS